ncbi:MAG: PQQ-binding-like beta-propeller repeat protein [Sphingomonadales bacterium]
MSDGRIRSSQDHDGGGRALALAAIMALMLAGCGEQRAPGAEQAQTVETPPNTVYTDDNSNIDAATRDQGRLVYESVCADCHDQGLNRAPQRDMLTLMTPESIYRAMSEGVMQPQAADLSEADRVLVAQYLSGRVMGAEAGIVPPLMCAEAARGFDIGRPPAYTGWGFAPSSPHFIADQAAGIDAQSVKRLTLKWALAFPNAVRARSQPALAGGAIFVGSHDGTVFALDQDTGCARWTFAASAEVRTAIVISDWTAGDDAADPLLYFGDLIGNVYAVKAFTGELLWKMRPEPHPHATITGAPTLHDGALYVPISSLEVATAIDPTYPCCTFRGSVVALDAATGAIKWQSHSIDQEARPTGINSAGAAQFGPSGAPFWNSPAIDEKRGQLYVASGENYSSPANDRSDAVFAMDLATGAINWVYQATTGDAWNGACEAATTANCPAEKGPDFDFGAGTILAAASNGRDYVLAGQKSGMVHAIDPDSGKLLWQEKLGRGGVRGGIHFGMAVDGDRLYVPVSDVPDGKSYDEPPRPGLYALDVKTGQELWQAPAADDVCDGRKFCDPGYSAAITATSQLVLAGGNDGYVRAYDSANGTVLWAFDSARAFAAVNGATAQGGSMSGGAAPVLRDGLMVVNSGYGFAGKMPGNALLVFEVED